MGTDIFRFWAQVRPGDRTHPADRPVLERVKHQFDLRCLPGCFGGKLRTAPLVLLFLSPGWDKFDLKQAEAPRLRAYYALARGGRQPLPGPDEYPPAYRWLESRTKCFGDLSELLSEIAVLNIGAYHSRTFSDVPLLAALPSSRVSLDWAQQVLFPQAIAGKRVVICLRAARFWGLAEGNRYGRSLFAPEVVRAGYMKNGTLRDEAIRAAVKMLGRG